MIKNIFIKVASVPLMLIALQSCFVAKQYKQPEVVEETYFRSDSLAQDSTTLADVSWRELFTDPILVSYIEVGLENNVDIRIAIQQINAAQAYYKQGKAAFFPTLNGTAQVNHQELSRNSQFGSFFNGAITQYQISGNLSWEADIWGKIRSQKRAYEASYLQTVAAHKAVKTQLISDIAYIYYQLLAYDEQLRIAEETIENRESSLETTRALKDAGYVTEVGVKQTEAQLYSARALWIDVNRNIKLLENTMSVLLGYEPKSVSRSSLDEQEITHELNVGYPAQLLRNRPDVIAAEYNLINTFELTNVAKSNFYPSLNISATGGFQSLQLDQLFSVNSLFATVVGGLTQPIWNGRQIRTQYEVAQSQEEIAYLNFRQALINASREVSDALYNFGAAEDRIALKRQEYQAYDLATEYSEELLNNGLINYLEVITARQNLLNAQLEVTNARFARLGALVDLYRALGGGWQ